LSSHKEAVKIHYESMELEFQNDEVSESASKNSKKTTLHTKDSVTCSFKKMMKSVKEITEKLPKIPPNRILSMTLLYRDSTPDVKL
jgi:hypothetical protein